MERNGPFLLHRQTERVVERKREKNKTIKEGCKIEEKEGGCGGGAGAGGLETKEIKRSKRKSKLGKRKQSKLKQCSTETDAGLRDLRRGKGAGPCGGEGSKGKKV